MSCGQPHVTDCREVLEKVYVFLDNEIDVLGYERIKVHLDECGPCLREYGIEELVKRLVCRCGREQAPEDLREKVLARLRQRLGTAE